MNERIGKLAVKAGAYWEHGDWNLPSAVCFSEKDLERFAELIVAECIEQVWYTREDGINGNVSEVIKERMKQHFGAE